MMTLHLRSGRAPVLGLMALGVWLAMGALPSWADPPPCRDGGNDCIDIGYTDAWYDGGNVQFEYSHRFFCSEPPNSDAPSACEGGAMADTLPPSGAVVSEVYVLIPLGFSPPTSTLHCPNPGRCIDHPSSIDLSRIVGSDGRNLVFPRHSFVIEDVESFQSTWWPVVLVGVKSLRAWNTIAAAKNIEAVDACQENGGCVPEQATNLFLFFQVLGPGMSTAGPE